GLEGRAPFDPAGIQGLAYRDSAGQAVRTARRPDIRDLDALPFPAWDLVDVDRYRRIWRERHGYYSMNMVTTRGCPYHCNWCAKPIWGQRYNVRSPENVVAELKWLKETYQPDHIWFADDIMGLKPGWIERFADLVEEHDARVPFKSLNRVDLLLRGNVIEALKRAGCRTVWVGAESGSQKILDAMEKGTTVEQIYEATRRLHEVGIEVGFFLQFGYPGETWEDIELTLQMVRDCRPDDIGISVSYPLPGTRFYENVKAELGNKRNWYDSEDLAMLYRGPYPTEFYRKLHTVVHHEFRARRACGLRWPGRRRPSPITWEPCRSHGFGWIDAREGTMRHKVVLYKPRAVFYTMPLALIAVGSALDPARFDVRIIDGRLEADPVAAVLSEIDDAVCLGVSVLTGDPIRDGLEVSRAVKARRPDLPVVWGGWHPSLFPEQCLQKSSIDAVVVGQGEET